VHGLACCVAVVGEDGLARNPPPIREEEFNQGHNVLNVGQAPERRGGLMAGDRFRGLLAVNEWRLSLDDSN
jgi:hypothetical protein